MKAYLKLIRIKHYTKNLLIFTALVFSGQLLVFGKLCDCAIGFLAFCFVSSAIYIFNDIRDKEKDRIHPKKCKRPIASGEISVKNAIIVMSVCLFAAAVCFVFIFNLIALLMLLAYILINIGYSLGLKNYPLVDVTILVTGFLIRVLFGAIISGIVVSNWLYLTVISLSFFMAFGKRRNELKQLGPGNTRQVLKSYNANFLEKSMYMCLTMANTFYSLWAMSDTDDNIRNLKIITVPFVFLITLRYCMNIENESSDGDPTEVLFHDKALMILSLLYAIAMILILYQMKY